MTQGWTGLNSYALRTITGQYLENTSGKSVCGFIEHAQLWLIDPVRLAERVDEIEKQLGLQLTAVRAR